MYLFTKSDLRTTLIPIVRISTVLERTTLLMGFSRPALPWQPRPICNLHISSIRYVGFGFIFSNSMSRTRPLVPKRINRTRAIVHFLLGA